MRGWLITETTCIPSVYQLLFKSNPQNWPAVKKNSVLTRLCFYSMAVCRASSMYVPGEGVMRRFHIGATPAAIGLAIYVVGLDRSCSLQFRRLLRLGGIGYIFLRFSRSSVSLLAGLSVLGVFGMYYLYLYGAFLRSKSTFAAH